MSAASPPETLADAELVVSSLDFPVVGIGASAGGIDALIRFFELLPGDTGMAFVVIVHLSPEHASSIDSVLQAVTTMTVEQVSETTHIEANRVYVIPPTKHLSMNDSYLRVTAIERPRGRPVAIDLFFRTLALVHRDRAVAIVLSGTGTDGAVGIARVKEQGGLTIAQSPDDAGFDGMPRAAIATRTIDWVLPVAEMPDRLVQMWANARRIELPATPEDDVRAEPPATPEAMRQAEDALREIMATLRARTGHDFRHYKRASLLRRLERRLQVNGLPNLPSYREFLHEKPEEAHDLLKDLLIGVTNFFRDREAFEALDRQVLPALFGEAPEGPPVRAWVPGCASGEEAYSIAMLLSEHAEKAAGGRDIHVFASDIDEQAVAIARAGAYPESIAADVLPGRLRRFFNKSGDEYRIRKELRERVLFAAHNILRDPPFSNLDLISCRNLLIYLDRSVHAELLEMFHFALRPGGYLFLGSSESVDAASPLFSVVDKKHRIFRANAISRTSRRVPAFPLGPPESALAAAERVVKRQKPSHAEIHQSLIEQFAPPSVLVDADSNIVHLSARTHRFLRHAPGVPSHNLLQLVQPELRLELRSALFQALQSGKSVEARRFEIDRDGRSYYINMIVRPVPNPGGDAPLALIVFDEVEQSLVTDSRKPDEEGRDPLVAQLEGELRRTREHLQETIEQSETSTEELKASNEELQAINEELRSTTEELETSKEELQSINEELITVNHELKSKVDETAKVNDDLQNLIASTDIATVFIDRGLAIKRFTPPAVQIFNLLPTDVGRSLLDITHRLDYEALAEDAGEAFQSLRTIEREVSGDNGRWYLARVLPYRTTEDRIDGAVLTFVDITSRRQAEERLRLVAESTKDYAIITLDVDGRITTWNQGAQRMFGYADNEAIGQPFALLFVPEDVDKGVPEAELQHARDDGRAEDDRWHRRKDDSRFFCSGITAPLHDNGVLKGYAKIARDLTGNKRVETAREALLEQETAGRAEAQAASELKDEFLAVMSHELKNPLNLIQLNAELLSRLPEARTAPAIARAATTIRKTVISQAQIIDDLLDLSRINTGKLALNRSDVDWSAVARAIAAAVAEDAAAKRIEMRLDIAEHVLVHADPVRVEQIVWNLLSNALKFTPDGGQVSLRLVRDGEFGVLEVRDNGRGIAPEFQPRMFEMFQQVETRSSRHEGGLGIGLALVRHIVALHGGRISGRSDGVGRGACFTVRLPLAGSPSAAAAQRSQGTGVLPPGLRALVVDDDLQSLETLSDLLGLEGVQVITATGGAEALALVERESFDVVISDIAMPEMNGYQLIEAMRRKPGLATTPMIALTGFGRPADAKRSLAAGYDLHLAKPVTLERLTDALRAVLKR
jgi:two-component system CheB/CheR fusion protein